jgi:hypothetical protein
MQVCIARVAGTLRLRDRGFNPWTVALGNTGTARCSCPDQPRGSSSLCEFDLGGDENGLEGQGRTGAGDAGVSSSLGRVEVEKEIRA